MSNSERRPLLPGGDATGGATKKRTGSDVVDVNVVSVEGDRNGYGGTDNANGRDRDEAVVDEEALEANGTKPVKVKISRIVLPLAIGIFLAAMDGTIVASSYASIGSELHQLQSTSWIATGYMLTLTSFQPLYGKLSDIFGRKGCLIFAYSVFALGSLLCGLAQNMTGLIAARALAGLGGGGMTTVVSILVSDIVPLRERGTWQGVLNIIFASGSATGAPLGGILADSIGWRWAFLIQVPFTLLAILSVSTALPSSYRPPTSSTVSSTSAPISLRNKLRRVDFLGAFLLVLAVFTLLLALDRGGNVGWEDKIVIGCAVSSFLLFAGFGFVELKVDDNSDGPGDQPAQDNGIATSTPAGLLKSKTIRPEPFAPRRILLSRSLLPAYLCNFFGVASGMCMLFHAPLYFQAVAHQSASQAGLRLLPAVVGGVVGSLIGGMVMQKTGKYWALTVGVFALECVGTSVVGGVTWWIGMNGFSKGVGIGVGLGLMTMSLGNGAGITTTLVALIANAAKEDQAIATAVSYLFRSLGSVLGISLGSTLVQDSLRTLLRKRLAGFDLDVDEIAQSVRSSLDALDSLPPSIRTIVRSSYADAVQASFVLSVAFAMAAFVSSVFIKEKALTR